jgi:TetR/AcrR family transcriptional regulator, lmrAB and yxaGH operons repressor
MPRTDVRAAMIRGAADLLAAEGLSGTSFSDVLSYTRSPRGSTYHHFPGGKDELLREALALVGHRLERAMTSGPPPRTARDVVTGFVGLWRASLVASGATARCPVAAVSNDPPSDQVLGAARDVFRRWGAVLATQLLDAGFDAERANRSAIAIIALVEGAVLLARTDGSVETFDKVTGEAQRLVEP